MRLIQGITWMGNITRQPLAGCFLLAVILANVCMAETNSGKDGERIVHEDGDKKPNVLLIGIDTLRSDYLSCYSAQAPHTPHIDRLAKEGIIFENHFSCCPWTAPSFLSIMTGLYPSVHGVTTSPYPETMSETCVTLAEVLKGMGYTTAAFTEGGYAGSRFGLGQGFDHFPLDPDYEEIHYTKSWSRLEENMDRFLDWLGSNRKYPFFAFFHTYEPHYPYHPPESFIENIRPEQRVTLDDRERVAEILVNWGSQENGRSGDTDSTKKRVTRNDKITAMKFLYQFGAFSIGPTGDLSALDIMRLLNTSLQNGSAAMEPALAYIRELYRAEVLYTNAKIGEFMEFLEKAGLLENTMIVFTSDHGEALGAHESVQHGSQLYREFLQVPLIIRMPDRKFSGRKINWVSRSIDIMPTIVDYLGGEIPAGTQGRSLLRYLDKDSGEGGDNFELPSFAEAISRPGRENSTKSIRTRQWSYIYNIDSDAEWIFDVENDLDETRSRSRKFRNEAEQYHKILIEQMAQNESARDTTGSSGLSVEPVDDETKERLKALGYVD